MTTDAENLYLPWIVVWYIIYDLFYDLFYNLPTGGDIDIWRCLETSYPRLCYFKDSLKCRYFYTKFHLGFAQCIGLF